METIPKLRIEIVLSHYQGWSWHEPKGGTCTNRERGDVEAGQN